MAKLSLRGTRSRRRDPDPPDAPFKRKAPCWVLQRRDGSFVRDEDGEVVWNRKLAGRLYGEYLTLVDTTGFTPENARRAVRESGYVRLVQAYGCGPGRTPTVAPGESRPPTELSPVDRTTLRLIASARRSDAAAAVAHDHMLIHYPAYAEAVREAGRRAARWQDGREGLQYRFDHTVFVWPSVLVEALRVSRERGHYKRTLSAAWHDAITVDPINARGWSRRWVRLFTSPAPSPTTRRKPSR